MMATPSVDSRIHNDYDAILKDISTSNTRKRYNISENKTKRKYNPASNKNKNDSVKNGSGSYSKKIKQTENSNNSPRNNVISNPFLVPADVTPRDYMNKNKNSSGSKKQRIDKKENNVFLTSSTNIGQDGRDGRDGRDWKYSKDTDHKTNIFIQTSTNTDSFSSSFLTSSVKRNSSMQNTIDTASSLGNKGCNYFIHNSKIQLNRRQGDDSSCRHSSIISETQSVLQPPQPTTVNINIQDVEQFPSLTSSAATTSSQIISPTNIWTKNKLKIKADIVSSTETEPTPLVAPPIVQAITITVPIVATFYKAKTVSQSNNVLSRDNIFLGAFTKSVEPSPELSCDDNYNNDNSIDSNIHIPMSILVDNCDTSYDRFYK